MLDDAASVNKNQSIKSFLKNYLLKRIGDKIQKSKIQDTCNVSTTL